MQASLEGKKEKGEGFRAFPDKIERWAERELEDCNVEGSIKGGGKMLKPSGEKTKSFHFRLKEKEIKNIKRANRFGRKEKGGGGVLDFVWPSRKVSWKRAWRL